MIRCKTLGEAGLHYYYLHQQRYRGNELLHSFTELNIPWTAIPYSWVSSDMLSFLALDCRLVALSFGAAWHWSLRYIDSRTSLAHCASDLCTWVTPQLTYYESDLYTWLILLCLVCAFDLGVLDYWTTCHSDLIHLWGSIFVSVFVFFLTSNWVWQIYYYQIFQKIWIGGRLDALQSRKRSWRKWPLLARSTLEEKHMKMLC